MKPVFFAIPRFALSGGNLVTLSLANHLANKGFKVLVCSGFSIKDVHEVSLRKYKKGFLNSFLNLLSYFCLSLQSLFFENYVATHHLTSLLNFVKKSRFSFVQDVEKNFYPSSLCKLGNMLWENYLLSKKILYTSQILAEEIHDNVSCLGFPFVVSKSFSIFSGQKVYDALLILRDGEYKNPESTLRVFNFLKGKGLRVALINGSKLNVVSDNVFQALDRDRFISLLGSSRCFICLSEWEGLGLPNIEAYCLGLSIISTPIPSAKLLNKLDSNAVTVIEKVNPEVIYSILSSGVESKITVENILDRQKVIASQNDFWLENVSKEIVNNIVR